jgi:transcriptional antiterminator RfaH
MLNLHENPSIVLPGLNTIAAVQGDWWVVHTRPRCEKALAWDLTHKNIPYFLPMSRRAQIWGGRRRLVLQPLFPSYLFVCGDSPMRGNVLATGRAVNILPVPQRQQFVDEIESLRIALDSNVQLNLYPFVTVGRRVRVARGPMMGMVGMILETKDFARLVLQVTALGTSAELVIDAALLEDLN